MDSRDRISSCYLAIRNSQRELGEHIAHLRQLRQEVQMAEGEAAQRCDPGPIVKRSLSQQRRPSCSDLHENALCPTHSNVARPALSICISLLIAAIEAPVFATIRTRSAFEMHKRFLSDLT